MNWPSYFEPLALTYTPPDSAMKFDLSEDHFRKLQLEGLDRIAAAAAGEISASTPVSANVSVTDGAGGTEIVAALAAGQIIEVSNNGSQLIYLRLGGNPAIGTGYPLAPGATFTTPRAVTTALKGIAPTGTSVNVTYHRYP